MNNANEVKNIEIGQILEGKVVKLAKYGAFVALEDIKTLGLIHISEVTDAYVKDVGKYFHIGDIVKVKVIGKSPDGKIALSTKQVEGSTFAEKVFSKAENTTVNLDKVSAGSSTSYLHKENRHGEKDSDKKLEVLIAKFNRQSADVQQAYQNHFGGINNNFHRNNNGKRRGKNI